MRRQMKPGESVTSPQSSPKGLYCSAEVHERNCLGKVREAGLTLVPLALYFKDGGAKVVEIALAKGKKDYDKRQTLKQAQDKREIARAVSTLGKEW